MNKTILNSKMILVIALIIVGLLAACGNSDSNENSSTNDKSKSSNNDSVQTVDFWYAISGAIGEEIEDLANRFNESQDEIEIIPTYQGEYAEHNQKVQQAVAANNAPDLVMIERGDAPGYFEFDILEDLNQYFDDSEIPVEDFKEGLMGSSYHNDQLLTLPFNRSIPVLYVNQDLFDEMELEIPTNWEELKDVSTKLAIKENDKFERYGFTFSASFWTIDAFILQAGGNIFNDDYSSDDFTQNGTGKKAFEYLKELQKNGGLYYYPGEGNGTDVTPQMFADGKIGMMLWTTGDLGRFESSTDFDITVHPLPAGERGAVESGGANLAMLKDSENKDATWKFIEWIYSDAEGQALFSKNTGYLPASNTIENTDVIQDFWDENPNAKRMSGFTDMIIDTNSTSSWNSIKPQFTSKIEEIMVNDADIDKTLEEIHQIFETEIELDED